MEPQKMKFICALSNEVAGQPVVSPVSGNVFERRLILKYLEEHGNRDPINGNKLKEDELIGINMNIFEDNQSNQSRKEFSVPELVRFLQEQWDSMVLQIFSLKKQLQSSEREREMLLNQQNDSSKIISILNNELIKYKQRERKCSNDLNQNIYSNLSAIDNCSNKENFEFTSSSINSSNGSSLNDRYHLTNHCKANSMNHSSATNYLSMNSKLSDHVFGELCAFNQTDKIAKQFDDLTGAKFFDRTNSNDNQSPAFTKYNKQLSYSTEYVNLNSNKLTGRHHRPQSVIIQNDSLFDAQLNDMKSCDENLNLRNEYLNQANVCCLNQKNAFKLLSEQITPSSSGSLRGSYANNLTNNLTNAKRIPKDELYCNLMEMKEYNSQQDFDQISLTSRRPKSNLTNYENILMFDEEHNSQQSINKIGTLRNKIDNQTKSDEIGSKVSRAASWSNDFNNLLNDRCGIEIFRNFLVQEHSAENIKFWESCEQYRNEFKRMTNKDRKKRAEIIFSEFFKSDSPFMINVEDTVKVSVKKNLSSPGEDLFREAQTKIYNLMRDDSYRRFLASHMYKESLTECNENNRLPIVHIKEPSLPINNKNRRKSLNPFRKQKN